MATSNLELFTALGLFNERYGVDFEAFPENPASIGYFQDHQTPINLDAASTIELEVAASHPCLHEAVRKYAYHMSEARKHNNAGYSELVCLAEEKRASAVYETEIPEHLKWQ